MTDHDLSASSVNYDEPPIVELEVEGMSYRLDTSLGSAVAVSQRELGTWTWTPLVEGRWDGSRLRARGLDHAVVSALGEALRAVMAERADQDLR